MSESARKPVRTGQAHKRADILTAARDLFVESGVDRVSMDAIAARAGVSKRTVYDYYGDKRRLLLDVIEDAGQGALSRVRELVAEHLPDDITDGSELERALSRFAGELGASQFGSTNYIAAVRLIAENEALLPELEDHPLDDAHADALAERFARLADRGLLDVEDARLAADHFSALTTLRVLNEPLRRRSDADHVRRTMIDGAHTFLRAYASRRAESV